LTSIFATIIAGMRPGGLCNNWQVAQTSSGAHSFAHFANEWVLSQSNCVGITVTASPTQAERRLEWATDLF